MNFFSRLRTLLMGQPPDSWRLDSAHLARLARTRPRDLAAWSHDPSRTTIVHLIEGEAWQQCPEGVPLPEALAAFARQRGVSVSVPRVLLIRPTVQVPIPGRPGLWHITVRLRQPAALLHELHRRRSPLLLSDLATVAGEWKAGAPGDTTSPWMLRHGIELQIHETPGDAPHAIQGDPAGLRARSAQLAMQALANDAHALQSTENHR